MIAGSCTDLDVTPRQSLTPEITFANATGYQSLVFSTYGNARGFNSYGQQFMIAPDVMADNLRIIANTGRYIGQEANADRAISEFGIQGIGQPSIIRISLSRVSMVLKEMLH